MENVSPDQVKLWFRLTRDEDRYPPADQETLWASPLGNELFKIDNIPFFAKGVSIGDVVTASSDADGTYWFESVRVFSGRSTVRVIVFREAEDKRTLGDRVTELRFRFTAAGCETEQSHLPGLFAVDVPPDVNFNSVRSLLEEVTATGWLDYEESSLRHKV